MKYSNIVFDLDGVVSNTSDIHKAAWIRSVQLFEQYYNYDKFLPFSSSDFELYVNGKSRVEGISSIAKNRDWRDYKNNLKLLEDNKNKIFLSMLNDTSKSTLLFSDAFEILKIANGKNCRIACCSSSKNARKIAQKLGVMHFFDVFIDGEDIEKHKLTSKPSPDPFLHTIKQLGVKAQDSIIVEDSKSGLISAIRANAGLVVFINRNGAKLSRDPEIIETQKIHRLNFHESTTLIELETFLKFS